jgi:hypothetical protein
MRKTVLWQSPHVRASLSALLALVVIVFVAGCGGGGGGGGNNNGGNNNGANNGNNNGNPPPGQNPTLPFVSGRVTDTGNPAQGVVGADITLFGTGVPDLHYRVTSADGTFTIANVDPRYTTFSVVSPDTTKYYNYALYTSKQYDTLNCRLPLPTTLVAGNNNLPTNIVLFSAGNNPPPPPPLNGCP